MAKQKFNRALIGKINKSIEKLVIDRMDKIAIKTYSILADVTPKDTGQAARGWNFTLNKRDKSVPVRPKKGEPRLRTKPAVPNKQAKKIGDAYNLTNAVKHIVFLNEGSSPKAEADFIDRAVTDAVKAVK